ncbi:MAG TPA: UDP-N-acetylmuramate--L-alanine ligase [Phycisphaerales bacterium]|nr:UDP-N-acetylmuramate--L-alanine ligase [Phycisphaerales bacterium]
MSALPSNPAVQGDPLPPLPRHHHAATHLALTGPVQPWDVKGKRCYLVGIGGSGMQGMARMLKARGAIVSGSDSGHSPTTDRLAADGFAVDFDQSKQWLPEGTDIVIASAAVKPEHPQMLEAATRAGRGVETLWYAEALGRCMLGRTAICIAGTHGKSTTTSMLACVLADCGIDPTAIVGATCGQLGGAAGVRGGGFVIGADTIAAGGWSGRPGVVVAESCEFNRSFHHYHPTMAAITSVEADHLDVYGTLDAVVESFHHFASLIAPESEGGLLLIAHDGAHKREVTAGIAAKVETIGFHPDADWTVTYDPATRGASVTNRARSLACAWAMLMPGSHNAVNAATAAAFALVMGAEPGTIAASLSQFRGVDRRVQLLGVWKGSASWQHGVRVIDDYGHHPTEVSTTLRALRQSEQTEAKGGRLICVFQPHQHSRTRHLMEEFAAAFDAADIVIVPHIYFARDTEEDRRSVTSADLVDRLIDKGVQAMHLYPFKAIVTQLQTMCRDGDTVVFMGAGPVNQIGFDLLKTSKA